MPDGTVEDSRSNSPQWGYLRVEDSNYSGETMQESANRLDPKKDKGLHSLVNNLDNFKDEPWNKILVFVNETNNPDTGDLKRGDKVSFNLIEQEVKGVIYWVAEPTGRTP